ncbi:MAG: ABC transporter ATP-binding protein [Planctomycetota bacterium]
MIEVSGLRRRFEDFEAVRGISFTVPQGDIFGFIGPNGAGKTTTIRILATLLLPTAGTARIQGFDVTEDPERVREVMGYMPDLWGVYPDLTVREYLSFFAASYGLARKDRARAVGDVMDLTDLAGLADRLVEQLSKGMKQRLCLAKTLVHDPQLLILDEPADGLDPRARIELRELLRELSSMGKTILISSHILTELSDLVTSVGIVERGRLLMAGPVDEIVARLAGVATDDERDSPAPEGDGDAPPAPRAPVQRYRLRVAPEHVAQALELLLSQPGVDASVAGEQELVFSYRGVEREVSRLVRTLGHTEIDVLGLTPLRADLETVFMAVTRGQVQ